MNKPLALLIAVIIALIGFQCYHSLPTGAAATQSTVTIYAPQAPIGPAAPAGPAPALAAPTVPAAPAVQIPALAKVFYIGDFALNNSYTVSMGVDEIWIYTFRNKNYTFSLVYLSKDYGEFDVEPTTQHLKLFVGQSVWIDSDLNGYSDVKITFNSVENGRVNVTLGVNLEKVLFETINSPAIVFSLFSLFIILVIDTIIHHIRERVIFKHFRKRDREREERDKG
jgi:hypothetical protein